MHPAGEKRGRPKNKYTAHALESIKQDLTRFQVQRDNGGAQVSEETILTEFVQFSAKSVLFSTKQISSDLSKLTGVGIFYGSKMVFNNRSLVERIL